MEKDSLNKKEKKSEVVSRYFEAVGRRKTAVARVRVFSDKTGAEITVNGKRLKEYFSLSKHQNIAKSPFLALPSKDVLKTSVRISGGGLSAQAEAVRLGIARALTLLNPESRSIFKTLGYLSRDSRKVERKKFGFRKARRPQQWRKR